MYPEITINPIEELEINSPVVEIAESDIDNMVEKLRSQKTDWKEVKTKAKEGNRVTINFEGSVGDKPISEEPIKSFPVEIGSKKHDSWF